jgi:hypothetical protein
MARLGVPEGIDLRLLRGYLRRESLARPVFFEPSSHRSALSRASLLRLEEEIGLPDRSWVEALLAERLLIATSLIVALCLVAIRLAPPAAGGTRVAGSGAQP